MNSPQIQLNHDVISDYLLASFQRAFQALGSHACLSVERRNPAQVKTADMYTSGFHDLPGVELFYNADFASLLMRRRFGDKVNPSAHEDPFARHVIQHWLLDWFKKEELLWDASEQDDQSACFRFCAGEAEILLSLSQSVQKRILTQKLSLDLKKRPDQRQVLSALADSPVKLSIELPIITTTVEKVRLLKQGDVLKTNRKINDGLILKLDHQVISNHVFVSFENGEASLIVGSVADER
ncbi:FliM/FliN family flagellar motor switch protein [Photobacterium sp. CCB-ST2H9]|uniref:FliM/FliN family flagellar motor switch protein n=1 Tax=Photobacterium sp. CCB-ST2H9 TaxID=2912855 RepID=UPI002003279B|nr:FliM/FliN family flagellar motor switch protein [Photobacterium sp. CCB-ST2H9]UTM58479.1 FliM/FliN family flagellar motor switch protein [Photobacterium sp. CCB-ST2H9]